MKGLIAYFIKYPIASNLLMTAIFVFGIYGLLNMSSTFFPESESKYISIQSVYLGASPEEIEEGVVTKIEENVRGLTGVERVTSTSSENLGSVSVEVARGYDIDLILTDVKNSVDRINSFPAAMEPPTIYKRENINLVISFALSGDVDLKTLKRFGRDVEDELLAMEGISKISLRGYPEEEIEIAFREQDLINYQITFAQAAQAVRAANLEITGGTIEGDKEDLLIRANNKNYYANDLRDIVVINAPNTGVVRLHQIADIRDQWKDDPTRSYMNGEQAVILEVSNTLEESALDIAADVMAYLDDFNEKNDVVKATIVRDETLYLKQRLALLTENGLMGFGIVLVLLACFLHWRLAFWVALSIPISFAGMFFCAMAVGATINIISLFAMILVIGILVDDGIVVSESIYQEYERGLNPTEAAIKGTLRVFPAVFGAILTTCIAFGGFYFISGRFGEFFGEMSTIVIFSLIFSLVEAAFILPAHISHSKALNRDKKKGRVLQFFEGIMNWIRDRVYTPALDFSLNNKGIIIASLVALFMATIGAIQGGIIQATFFPNIEFDNSIVTLELPSGTNERITDRWMDKIEESIYAVNEDLKKQYFDGEKDFVVKVTRNSGPKSNQGNIGIVFLDAESREDVVTVSDMNKMIRKKIGPIPDAETFTIGSVGAFGKPVSLTLVGDNLKELDTATEALKDSLRRLEELTDIGDDNQEGLREVNIKLNEKAHYLGLNLQEVVSQVRAGFFGTEIQRLQRGRDEVRVWVRYQREERNNVQQLKDMRIRFADGREFPLAEIADFEIERGVISIKHISGKRGITVDAELSTTDASAQAINANITGDILPQILERHPTVSFTQEGEARESAKSFESMGPVFTISFLIMFFVIALTFRSVGQTIAVAIIIPFGFIGVGFGHWLMGFQLSMSSYLGIFALIGVLVNDTLVFITTYNQLIASGKEQLEAVREAGISRFRPIVLTTLTTVAGLTPLLFEKSVQAQFLIPMAISVAFGLIVATVIILLLLPVLLMIMNRIRVYGLYVWEGEKLAPELVEPAVIGRKSNYLVWAVSALLLLGVFVAVVFLTIQLTGFLF